MLTEQTKTDRIEILEDGQIQVREARIIYDNGAEISRTFRRYVLSPATDTQKLVDQPAVIQNIANVVWTQDVIDASKATFTSSSAI